MNTYLKFVEEFAQKFEDREREWVEKSLLSRLLEDTLWQIDSKEQKASEMRHEIAQLLDEADGEIRNAKLVRKYEFYEKLQDGQNAWTELQDELKAAYLERFGVNWTPRPRGKMAGPTTTPEAIRKALGL